MSAASAGDAITTLSAPGSRLGSEAVPTAGFDSEEAREHLQRAHSAFEDLGAAHWATRVDAELRAAGDKGRATGRAGLAQLTPQELQVALTVARGASNREAASPSEDTVASLAEALRDRRP